MAATAEQKKEFQDQLKKLKGEIDGLEKEISILKSTFKKKPETEAHLRLGVAIMHLKIMGFHMAISDSSSEILSIKNETYLNNARKEAYKILQVLEELVSNEWDITFGDAYDRIRPIKDVSSRERLNLLKGVFHNIEGMVERFGPNTKWRWSFPEMYGRLAIISRNLTDWRKVENNTDPRDPDYYPTLDLVKWVKERLYQSAQAFKSKYDLMDNKVDEDLKRIIQLFEARLQIHQFFGEQEEASKIKTLMEATQETLSSKKKGGKKKKTVAGKGKKKK